MTTPTPERVLAEARSRSGMTLREAAPRLGIDFTYLSKVENGHERPSDALLLRMCDLYGLEPDAVVLARAVAEVPAPVRAAIEAAALTRGLAGSGDVLALREAVRLAMAGTDEYVDDLLDRYAAAVRAETLAGSGVMEALELLRDRPAQGYPCGGCGHHDLGHEPECWWARAEALVGPRQYQPAPVVERCAHVIEEGLTCNVTERWHSDRSGHPFTPAALAATTPAPEAVERPDPERLLDAIEAQAIGEVGP